MSDVDNLRKLCAPSDARSPGIKGLFGVTKKSSTKKSSTKKSSTKKSSTKKSSTKKNKKKEVTCQENKPDVAPQTNEVSKKDINSEEINFSSLEKEGVSKNKLSEPSFFSLEDTGAGFEEKESLGDSLSSRSPIIAPRDDKSCFDEFLEGLEEKIKNRSLDFGANNDDSGKEKNDGQENGFVDSAEREKCFKNLVPLEDQSIVNEKKVKEIEAEKDSSALLVKPESEKEDFISEKIKEIDLRIRKKEEASWQEKYEKTEKGQIEKVQKLYSSGKSLEEIISCVDIKEEKILSIVANSEREKFGKYKDLDHKLQKTLNRYDEIVVSAALEYFKCSSLDTNSKTKLLNALIRANDSRTRFLLMSGIINKKNIDADKLNLGLDQDLSSMSVAELRKENELLQKELNELNMEDDSEYAEIHEAYVESICDEALDKMTEKDDFLDLDIDIEDMDDE